MYVKHCLTGATFVSGESVTSHIKTGDHGTTFAGNSFACKIAYHVFERLATGEMSQAVKEKSKLLIKTYHQLSNKYPSIFTEVRGRGLILGSQLSDDAKAKASEVITAATRTRNTDHHSWRWCSTYSSNKGGMEILDRAMTVVFHEPDYVEQITGQQEMAGR